jgi:type I restriction enzyme S subunit
MTQPLVLHAAEETLEAVHTRRHATYPAYKPSGVEWLGGVPEHWDVKRLKFVARTIMGQSPNSEEYTLDENGTPFLQGNAEFGKFNPTARYYCETATKHAPAGSIFVSVRAPVGAVNVADCTYGIGRGLCAVVPDQRQLFTMFAWHALSVTRNELWSIATGSTYEAVTADEVAAMSLPVPPLKEQQAIARFLDEQTQKIDDLIEAKRSLLDLLKEKRQAVITHAVTRGLDPAAKLKPSGVEWLGDVPEHWGKVPLKFLCRLSGGFTPSTSNADYWGGEIPWVSPKDMKMRRISDTEDHVTGLAVSDIFRSVLQPGAVLLVVRSGILKHSLPVAINDVPVVVNQDIKALVVQKRLTNKYLARLIEGNQKSLLRLWTKPGTTVESIESEYLLNETIPVPPLEEQQAIARFLEEETEKMDDLESVVREAIETLESLRTGIISAAVTGKIDVREEGV